MVHYYEDLVKKLLAKLGHSEMYDELLNEYAEEKTKSSSPVLYGFGKYEPLNNLLGASSAGDVKLLSVHIMNAEMWSYPGFCPFVSTDRFAKLCRFPADIILSILGEDPMGIKVILAEKMIQAPPLPTIKDYNIPLVVNDNLPILELGKIILNRLKKHSKLIHSWELYYIECAKQVGRIDKALFESQQK
jgi:hypothetical protein